MCSHAGRCHYCRTCGDLSCDTCSCACWTRWVLLCGMDYEASYLLGVFTSEQEAQDAEAEHRKSKADDRFPMDWYDTRPVQENVVYLESEPM